MAMYVHYEMHAHIYKWIVTQRRMSVDRKKVGIILGGKSAEHEVSLQSAKNIVEAIDPKRYEVVLIGIDKQGSWHVNDPADYLTNADDPENIQLNTTTDTISIIPGERSVQDAEEKAHVLNDLDAIFPIVHGTLGEDGSLQGLLRVADVPFVGADVLSSAICMDKDIAKKLLSVAGIHVAKGVTFSSTEHEHISFTDVSKQLGDSMFVKPANQGSSVGVSKVHTEEEFNDAIEEAFMYDHKIVIEETIVGREIECSILGNENPEASLPGEIVPQTSFYSYESKYIDGDGAVLEVPAQLSEEQVKEVQDVSIRAYKALQCEGLARVDVFLTEDGNIYVNEINTLPGFTKISMYPKLWEVSGMGYSDLIHRLIELGIERHERDQQLKSSV